MAIVNPTPRQQFQESPDNISKHRALIELPQFARATHMALLQYQRQLTDSPPADMGGAAGAYLRILGAQEFVNILLNLGEQPQRLDPRSTITQLEQPATKK